MLIDLTDICREILQFSTKALYFTFKDQSTQNKISYVKFHGVRDPEVDLRPQMESEEDAPMKSVMAETEPNTKIQPSKALST